jgi:holo-[acyl-carrier protein] synthase
VDAASASAAAASAPRVTAAGVPGRLRLVAIVGVGVDVVDVARLTRALERTPSLADRLFTDGERTASRPEQLAARFAAKEAAAKALGAPGGLSWRDAEVVVEESGRPRLEVHGGVAEEAQAQGIRTWHLSMSHDGGVATAVVVAES